MIRSVALILCLTASLLPASGTAMPADSAVHSGHFEKNDSGLKGAASYRYVPPLRIAYSRSVLSRP